MSKENNKPISLYELIKQKSQKKGRPLKIVCDWDECLFAFRPFAIYELGKISKPFKDYFEDFSKNTIIERKGAPDKNAPKYSRTVMELHDPFLLTAEDLLKCLKENLISRLAIISATKSKPSLAAKRKKERFDRSFSKFPQCSLDVSYVER
ncbi:886_t:CDS:2, partial [Entrophospora sp. SA101]